MWKFIALAIVLCIFVTEGHVLKGVTVQHRPWWMQLNDGKMEGFTADLIKEIAKIGGFNYTLELTPDGRYGVVINNTMTGMVGEVANERADFAIADLTITDKRREYVDFTEPFIEENNNLVILIHRNNANNIRSFSDLADQTAIQYGCVRGGSTNQLIYESTDPVFTKMSQYMRNNSDNLVTNLYTEGVERVKSTPYAAIVEKTFAEYITGINCNLTFIDDTERNFPVAFGIALNKNSNYTQMFNTAIRQMKSSGIIDIMRNRYWKRCGSLIGVTLRHWPMADLISGKLEGYAVDIIKLISGQGDGFDYSLYFEPNNRYGRIDNGTISGMLGDVYNGRADFAVADITVTDVRKQFVDFTEPFAETGIVVLIHKNNTNNITSFSDLTQQSAIKYGTITKGSTYSLFANSTDPTLQEMLRQMNANPEVFVSNYKEGIQKVKTSPYALIVEKGTAEFVTDGDCDLTFIEDPNHNIPRYYAIALAKNSPHLEMFNYAIRELKTETTMNWIDNVAKRYRKQCGVLKGVTIKLEPYSMNTDSSGKISGFTADLMNEISTIIGKNYTLEFVRDFMYGRDGNNGMIGEVNQTLADFALADLTVTDYRKNFVDFTEPFAQMETGILLHKDNAANITSLRDLAQQTDFKFGCVKDGSTHHHFANSNDSTISGMFRTMNNTGAFIRSLWEGVQMAKSSRYGLICEGWFGEYMVGQNCNLTYVSDPDIQFHRQYAIALPKNSPHIQSFNSAISQLKANGVIDRIRKNYWKTCEQ